MTYRVVVIDPPWPLQLGPVYERRVTRGNGLRPALPYEVMSHAEIAALELPLADDAWVFCWATDSTLPVALTALPDAWGLKRRWTMVWHKPGGIQLPGGPAYTAEYVVIMSRAKPEFTTTKGLRLAYCWPRGAHSEKPEEFYDLLRRVTEGPRLDMFGRRRIAGFDSWGAEAPVGPALPDHYQEVM